MDPQVQAILDSMAQRAQAAGAPPMWELPPAEARANAETNFQAFNDPMPAGVVIDDRKIPGPEGDIPVKVFTPSDDGPWPLLVYFHGGGWVIGSPATHAKLCAELAAGAGAVVVSVDYRLAPEHPAPAPLDDCVAAAKWAVENAGELNATAGRWAIAGDSAGANLAAASCIRLRDEGGPLPVFQLLLYGVFQRDLETESMQANGEGMILERRTMEWFWEQYLSGGASAGDPLLSPVNASLEGVPPARLIVGTLDPLLDDSHRFAEALEKAGVPVVLSEYPDQPHLFLQLSEMLDAGKQGVAEAVMALRQALRQPA